tara:strand:+ start:365 stop:1075 length:711 start_codon:yes stop_codon:yes gene_type:complete
MGENNGVKNERQLKDVLNKKRFFELNKNMQNFMKDLDSNIEDNDIIKCHKQKGNGKSDLEIIIKKISFNVSVKIGDGLSIHEENFYNFQKEFLDKYNCSSQVKDILEKFIVKLGTNYKDKIKDDERKLVQKFLKDNTLDLLNRFLKSGRTGVSADYIYYGNCNQGKLMKIDEVIEQIGRMTGKGFFHIGGISLQAYCRDCEGKSDEQKKRLQGKIGTESRKIFSSKVIDYEEECEN